MLERIQGLPDNVLGFEAKGEVTGVDYESVLIPAVEEMLARQKSIRFAKCAVSRRTCGRDVHVNLLYTRCFSSLQQNGAQWEPQAWHEETPDKIILPLSNYSPGLVSMKSLRRRCRSGYEDCEMEPAGFSRLPPSLGCF